MSDFPNVSDVARYSKVKRVGKGSFGEVWLVKDLLSPKQNSLIMKEVLLKGLPASEKQATMNEVRVLQHLQHSNIIAYQNSFVNGEKLHIIMEHAAGGDLASAIAARRKQRGARFSEAEILTIVRELVDALSYCHHECKLLHRDLKPANIFLSSSGHVKLGDFGISKVMDMSCQLAHTQRRPGPLRVVTRPVVPTPYNLALVWLERQLRYFGSPILCRTPTLAMKCAHTFTPTLCDKRACKRAADR
jgi:serine/threonine protein kinase